MNYTKDQRRLIFFYTVPEAMIISKEMNESRQEREHAGPSGILLSFPQK